MATTAAILDLVSVDYLTNACVDWSDFLVAHWGSSILESSPVPLLPKPIHPRTTSHSGAYATPRLLCSLQVLRYPVHVVQEIQIGSSNQLINITGRITSFHFGDISLSQRCLHSTAPHRIPATKRHRPGDLYLGGWGGAKGQIIF
jgi:hypothetical protein